MATRMASGALLLLLLTVCQPARPNSGMTDDDEIMSLIRDTGTAPVLVALVAPPGFGDAAADTARVRAGIARVQAEVIAALDTADYRERRRFSNIPSISLTLRAERGLRTLLAHPNVIRVTIDASGGGTR